MSVLFFAHVGFSQFDVEAYKQFLSSHQNMTAEQLLALHPAGTFAKGAATQFVGALYSDSIQIKYGLTTFERSLIEKNGFMVSERLSRESFGKAFEEIYNQDLPVFVSTDAILDALHMSVDGIIQDIEMSVLIPKLTSLLESFHTRLPALASRYAAYPGMRRSLRDIDLYLTVPRKLMNSAVNPVFTETSSEVATMMGYIASQNVDTVPLFSSTIKEIDFSQFTVRGHYATNEVLAAYFQAMIWLGRMEMYLIAPQNTWSPRQTRADIQRQVIDAVLFTEIADSTNGYAMLDEIERILRFFTGESDNVSLPNMRTLMTLTQTDSACQLLDTLRCKSLQDTLGQQPWAAQRILSQILRSDLTKPEAIKPASAFMLFGQRFIIDSYIACNVVFDKILYNNKKVWRELPSRYDYLVALGNDAAGQLLGPELDAYKYASNLAALRYLVDSYEPTFWNGTIYNSWLNAIRILNPPQTRENLPRFMQTAAWWQEKMNTQLASWAEERHDFMLYAKQSYTGASACSFPHSYVEPYPEFYQLLKELANRAKDTFSILLSSSGYQRQILKYWAFFGSVNDTLESIARKELALSPLTDDEKTFLAGMIRNGKHGPPCSGEGGLPFGWYAYLFYGFSDGSWYKDGYTKTDYIVADVHTCPTDELGSLIGWVMHGGTGPVNLAVVTTAAPDGQMTSYIGPVSSYYEHVSTNFKRLTDQEWQTAYQLSPSFRPDFVNLYLADAQGSSRGAGSSLVTGVIDHQKGAELPSTISLGQNYPNPFNPTTIITFSIPQSMANSLVELSIYNLIGQKVKQLLREKMPAGNFATRWDGTSESGGVVASGVYFYRLTAGDVVQSRKLMMLK
jgi:hypothetical protein